MQQADGAVVAAQLAQDAAGGGERDPAVHAAAPPSRAAASMSARNACSASSVPVRGEQLGKGGVAEDAPLAQEDQPVAAHRLVHDVARDEQGAALLREPPEQVPQVAAQHGVETDRRLVEHEHLGVADEGAREVRPGDLPAGEVLDPGVGVVGEVDRLDGPVDLVGPRRP